MHHTKLDRGLMRLSGSSELPGSFIWSLEESERRDGERERKKGRRSWILVIGIFKMIDPDIEKNAGIFAGEALHCNKIIVKVLIQE